MEHRNSIIIMTVTNNNTIKTYIYYNSAQNRLISRLNSNHICKHLYLPIHPEELSRLLEYWWLKEALVLQEGSLKGEKGIQPLASNQLKWSTYNYIST